MGQNFYPDAINQTLLFALRLFTIGFPRRTWRVFWSMCLSALDLSAIYKSYQEKDGRGQAAYSPEMMVRLLLYGYVTGVYSSRKIQTRTFDDLAFRHLSATSIPTTPPSPSSASVIWMRYRVCSPRPCCYVRKLDWWKLGHVAIDGTKIKAYASKHKAMSYKRMNETEARLKQEIDALLAAAEQTDAEEDAQHGKDRHGDELPIELQRRESRLQKIREAKAALEQEAKEKAEQQRAETEQKLAEREQEERRTGKEEAWPKPKAPDPEQAKPEGTAQRNFVDPESRIMPDAEPTRAASCKVTTRRSRLTPRRR